MTNVSKSNQSYKVTKIANQAKVGNTRIRGLELDTSKFKYNQSPVESPNGVTVSFTLPNSDSFVSGLLEVFVNGNQKIKSVEWQENGTTGITFIGSYATTPPSSEEVIKFNYIKQ